MYRLYLGSCLWLTVEIVKINFLGPFMKHEYIDDLPNVVGFLQPQRCMYSAIMSCKYEESNETGRSILLLTLYSLLEAKLSVLLCFCEN